MAKAREKWASSLAEAKRLAVADVVGPSGAKFSVRPLTLDELVSQEALPDDLVRVALLEMVPGGLVAEIGRRLAEDTEASVAAARKLSIDNLALRNRIVLEAVVEPPLRPADLAALDPFDLEMLAGVAQHRVEFDAAGRRVGAEVLATFPEADSEP